MRSGAACAPSAICPGPPADLKVEVRGEGVGQVRIIDLPYGTVHEQLTSLDDDARSLTYIVPAGNPVPVTGYEARMTVSDDAGKGRLDVVVCLRARRRERRGSRP